MSKTYPVERSPIEDLPGESISLGEGITLQRGAIMRRGALVPGESISFGGGITLEQGAIMRPGVYIQGEEEIAGPPQSAHVEYQIFHRPEGGTFQEITDLPPEVRRARRRVKVLADRTSANNSGDPE